MINDKNADRDGLIFIRFLVKYRVTLIITLIVAVAATLVATWLMEPKYRSSGIIFPTPTNSPEKILFEPQFGYEVDADWLMQVLRSDIVRDTLNNKFNLVEHFEIDTSRSGWPDDFRKEYEDMLNFERTRYMSIEITAVTNNPQLSADIVNTVIKDIDQIRESIFKSNTYQSLIHYENAYFSKKKHINKLVDSIHNLRDHNTSRSLELLYRQIRNKSEEIDRYRVELDSMRNSYNFYDLETHLETLSSELTKARSAYSGEKGKYDVYKRSLPEKDSLLILTEARLEAATRKINRLETEIETFDDIKKRYEELTYKLRSDIEQLNELTREYENTANDFEPFVNSILLERLSSDYTHEQVLLNELRYKYENAQQNYRNPIPSVYVINRAEPSYEKVSPSLLKNGLIITAPLLLLVVGALALYEKFLSIKSRLNEPAG